MFRSEVIPAKPIQQDQDQLVAIVRLVLYLLAVRSEALQVQHDDACEVKADDVSQFLSISSHHSDHGGLWIPPAVIHGRGQGLVCVNTTWKDLGHYF